MYIIPLQAIVLYFISEYLHHSLAIGSRTVYVILMLPGTIAHELSHAVVALLMGSRITKFSVIPSGDTLGYVEHTAPKIPLIGNASVSIAPLFGCPAILLLISGYFGAHFDFPSGSFDILVQTRFLIDGTFYFITGLDYYKWKTYLFIYLALTLGAGAAPSKTDIINMLPGLIFMVVTIYVLNYFGVNIAYPYNVLSSLSSALTVAIIPLLAVTFMVVMLNMISFVRFKL